MAGWPTTARGGWRRSRPARCLGRPPSLSGAQLQRIYTLVVGNDPRQLQFTFALWTRAMVRELIRREFACGCRRSAWGGCCASSGCPRSGPVPGLPAEPGGGGPLEGRDLPQLRREAAEVGATIYFADEAGVRSDYHAGTTWAPVGRTPVVATTGDRLGINLISAVTAKGKLRLPPTTAA